MARVRERIRTDDAVALAGRLSALLAGETGGGERASGASHGVRKGAGGRIAVPTPTGELLIDADEIDWIEAQDYHAVLHAGAKDYRVRESLSALETRVDPAHFVRVHRRALVRLDQVRELKTEAEGSEAAVVLRDGTGLPVSRRRLAQVKSLLRAPTRRG